MTKESVTDKPVTRVSLKSKGERGGSLILKKFTTMLLQILQLPNTIKIEKYD